MTRTTLSTIDWKIVKAYADNNMEAAKTARVLYVTTNSVVYHLHKVSFVTGLNPYKFYDLVELIKRIDANKLDVEE